jgi:hypothetical protein
MHYLAKELRQEPRLGHAGMRHMAFEVSQWDGKPGVFIGHRTIPMLFSEKFIKPFIGRTILVKSGR